MSESLLYEMCAHCNNYFNPHNDPLDPTRNYPDAFKLLAEKIQAFIKEVERNNVTASGVSSASESVDLEYASWQKAFARELSIYKRARFI